ncbi:hypothetical protein DNTS_010971, partial [Danionella cerebrum]
EASVLALFQVNVGRKKVTVAGCRVQKGLLDKNLKFRLKRGNDFLWKGSVITLRHLKDNVLKVKTGMECGLSIDDEDFEIKTFSLTLTSKSPSLTLLPTTVSTYCFIMEDQTEISSTTPSQGFNDFVEEEEFKAEEQVESLMDEAEPAVFSSREAEAHVPEVDDILDLAGGAKDALERHMSTMPRTEDPNNFAAAEPSSTSKPEPEVPKPAPITVSAEATIKEEKLEGKEEKVTPTSTTCSVAASCSALLACAERDRQSLVELPCVPSLFFSPVLPQQRLTPPSSPRPPLLQTFDWNILAFINTTGMEAKHWKEQVAELLYWRDLQRTGVVFGASLFLLLSLSICSIISVLSYIALALLSVTISFRIYKGILQAVQKSEDGHPFKMYLDKDVTIPKEMVQKYSDMGLAHLNTVIKELRRLFLVDDLVDSLKFAVLMWILTYVGALFNGLTLLILGLIGAFSCPVIYEKHQVQIDHYYGLVNKQVKDVLGKIQAKIPGAKPKSE